MIYLGNNYIYTEVGKLIKRFKTRDPFELLDCMNIVVGETSNFKKLKGYCFMSCQTIHVMINSFLPDEEKRIVAAHELGHIILHRKQLKLAPMKDDVLYTMTNSTEYEANLNVSPDLMSFKLYSLMKRGHAYHMPMEIQSNFLAK